MGRRRTVLVAVAAALLIPVLGACSSGDGEASGDGPVIQEAGQAGQNLNDASSGAEDGGTIPLDDNDEPAIMRIGDTFTAFQDCLAREGYADADLSQAQTDPDSLDPGLRDALGKCNNETGLSEVFQEMQTENENLTPEQIEMRNIGFLAFRECAIRNGWTWGEPEPDENGLLGFGGAPEGPAGSDMSDLMDLCQGEASKAVEDAGGEGILEGG